jgi:hypothetical protein
VCWSASNSEQLSSFWHPRVKLVRTDWWGMVFHGADTVDIRTVLLDNGRNLDVNDQPWSGRPVTADHHLNRQRWITYSRTVWWVWWFPSHCA